MAESLVDRLRKVLLHAIFFILKEPLFGGREILDQVLIANEPLLLFFKFDFEKACDHVAGDFLGQDPWEKGLWF